MNTRDIRTSNIPVACDVCGRTLLRGEHAETYLAGGARRAVCELCSSRALHEGWVREGSVASYEPGETSPERRSFLARLRTRRESDGVELGGVNHDLRPSSARAAGPREPRHVHAVPTSAEHKVSSAVDAFNSSEHPRTVAGVARSLGAPGVSVRPSEDRPSVVKVVVSWELCWYRYEIDLSDDGPNVRLDGQGYELDELSPEELDINAGADDRGALAMD
ncbi:MAG: hypothetical protein QOJ25_1123 [Solirubrobacteraceae bacterium]|nr:hypothetical protein [Solirubrobacteraceae bacterium]